MGGSNNKNTDYNGKYNKTLNCIDPIESTREKSPGHKKSMSTKSPHQSPPKFVINPIFISSKSLSNQSQENNIKSEENENINMISSIANDSSKKNEEIKKTEIVDIISPKITDDFFDLITPIAVTTPKISTKEVQKKTPEKKTEIINQPIYDILDVYSVILIIFF